MKRSFNNILKAKLNTGLLCYVYKIPFVRIAKSASMTTDRIEQYAIRKQQFAFCEIVAGAYLAAELSNHIHIFDFSEKIANKISGGFTIHRDTHECLLKMVK